MIRAGELRDKIIIQRPVRVSNGSGGFDITYDTIIESFAKVVERNPQNEMEGGQYDLKTLVEFVIRYRPDAIEIGDRVIWRGFNFTVANSMKVDPLRRYITITTVSEMETSER